MYFMWRLRSFDVYSKLLATFYESIVASTLYFTMVCWGRGTKDGERHRVNGLVKKASRVVGL